MTREEILKRFLEGESMTDIACAINPKGASSASEFTSYLERVNRVIRDALAVSHSS